MMSRIVFHARWVVPITRAPIENGLVTVQDGRIVAVERRPALAAADATAIDLGDAAILPGFANAHTHLELTHLRGRVPSRGSFVDWVEALIAIHGDQVADEARRGSIRDGLQRSLASGTTTVADIGCGRRAVEEWHSAAGNVVGFLEVLGMGAKRFADHDRSVRRAIGLCEEADEHCRGAARAEARGSLRMCGSLGRVGISPHAPYSTDAPVYREAIEWALRTRRPVCTHLAESREELAFLADGRGPFRELLERRGLWDGSFSPPGCSPVEYVDRLGLLACRPLLAHVNYVTDSDLDRLASCGASVAYCPRTHSFFQHPPHRYRDMLARGINVCVGTDSLASNDSLSVLDELRFMRDRDSQLRSDQLLEMGTISGARALQLDGQIGSIEAGKRADLVVVPLWDPKASDPIDDLLSGDSAPSAVYVGGIQTIGNTPLAQDC